MFNTFRNIFKPYQEILKCLDLNNDSKKKRRTFNILCYGPHTQN